MGENEQESSLIHSNKHTTHTQIDMWSQNYEIAVPQDASCKEVNRVAFRQDIFITKETFSASRVVTFSMKQR